MKQAIKIHVGDEVNVLSNDKVVDSGTVMDYCANLDKVALKRGNGSIELVDLQRCRPIHKTESTVHVLDEGDELVSLRKVKKALRQIQDAAFLDGWFHRHGCNRLTMRDLIDFSLDCSIMVEIVEDLMRND